MRGANLLEEEQIIARNSQEIDSKPGMGGKQQTKKDVAKSLR